MKKVIVSLLVLAFVALAATGTVSAQCAAKTTTTSVATTCAQCTSCTTSTCCSCACPTTSCCPTVACCVVKQCCEVKEVKAMHAMPMWKPEMPVKAVAVKPVAVKEAAAPAVAAVIGSGQASTSTQSIKQTVTQTNTQSVGAISGNDNTINGFSVDGTLPTQPITTSTQTNTNTAVNANVPVNIQVKDVAVAWNNSTATSAE
jgi:hypothetical protein